MKAKRNIVFVVVVIGLCGCASGLKGYAALSPSELNANPSYYNDKAVLVKGYVTSLPEDHTLYESKELDLEATRRWKSGDKDFDALSFEWTKYCLTIANPGILYKNRPIFNKQIITIKGKFVDDYLTARTIDLGACPLPTAIIIDYVDLKKRYPSMSD